jgi:hypothetical protein
VPHVPFWTDAQRLPAELTRTPVYKDPLISVNANRALIAIGQGIGSFARTIGTFWMRHKNRKGMIKKTIVYPIEYGYHTLGEELLSKYE